MSSAAYLRSSLERSLEQRIPSAFSPRSRVELPTISSGIAELDELLKGGLPVGAITEIVGNLSSGRLTCAHAFLSRVMQAGHVCAWIDVSDSFDPESAAGSGVDLDRLLWVRCGESADTRSQPVSAPPASAIAHPDAAPLRSGGSPHPRSEVHGLSQALNTFLSSKPLPSRRRQVGTPGASNRRLDASARVEQVASDRLPSRRGSYLLQHREEPSRATVATPAPLRPLLAGAKPLDRPRKPWNRLDQALRSADLVLQAGGFGALVLDLGSVDPRFASRVPLATWFRFRAAAERTRVSLLLLSQHPCAQSSAEVVLRTSLALPEPGMVLTSMPYTIERLRQRFIPTSTDKVVSMRKPPVCATVAQWQVSTLWARGQ